MERTAVSGGLESHGGLAALREAHPVCNLHVGTGIAAGAVVLGAIGARDRLDFTVLGGVVNLASRLCAAAPPDGILVAGPVREALAAVPSLRFQPLPPITLKGYAAPVSAFAAHAAATADEVA
jgi:adenylate cyclase